MKLTSTTLLILLAGICAAAPCLGASEQSPPVEAPPPQPTPPGPGRAVEPSAPPPAAGTAGKGTPGTRRRKRPRCRSYASTGYRQALRGWQSGAKQPEEKYRDGFRELSLYAVNLGESARLFPYLADGSLDPAAVTRIEGLFRDKHTGVMHPVHPRLIKLLYKIADRFKARRIILISGYRESADGPEEGNHGRGRAADILVSGVKLSQVAYYARSLGHVGVGLYPVSGFVHLDVREGPSYFWVDRSGPGQPSCLVGVLRDLARKADSRYRAPEDEPKRHRNRSGDPLGATAPPEEPAAAGD